MVHLLVPFSSELAGNYVRTSHKLWPRVETPADPVSVSINKPLLQML